MKKYKITTLVGCMLLVTSLMAEKGDVQKLSAYDRIFKDKKVETKKGIVNIHKIEDKIYLEYPVNLLNRDIVMGTTVEEVSDIGESFVGQQPHAPIYLRFVKNDTLISITIRDNFSMISMDEDAVRNSIDKNNIPAILHSFGILAYTPDSSSVVFDATPFILSDHILFRPLDPKGYNAMDGLIVRKADYVKERSMVGDINSYSDNFSVTCHQSYNITSSLFGALVLEKEKPYTALAKRSFLFLPEKLYMPRISDPRIGVYSEAYKNFSAKENGVKQRCYAKRWRLEPSDTAAYIKGELVEPVKPITFYIDDKFPSKWIKYIKAGVERWNSAFEKIGFKNAIVAVPFPKDNPEFDPNNLKYNCIRYVPLSLENTSGPFWIDPRSGEILSADVYIYHDVSSLITMTRFIQTSAADESVRTVNIPEPLMAESLEHIVAHEIGHSLGLAHNMAGSASYPADSLRSPSFTQKYGTTSSIMDYASFNYIARPGDKEKGVKLTPPALGVYDYYAIKWLYSPVLSASLPEEETETLNNWIKEKQKDPMFRYGKEQKHINYDPTCQAEDLGNDAVKSAEYGIENLKYILLNANEWLEHEDPEYKFRADLYSRAIIQFNKYVSHILANVGGIYINKKMSGDPFDYYTPVPREKQRESLLYLLNLMEDLSWMDTEAEKDKIGIMASISDYCRILLLPTIFNKIKDAEYSSYLSDIPYTVKDAYEDAFNLIFRHTANNQKPSAGNLKLQEAFITVLLNESGLNSEKMNEIMMFSALTNCKHSIYNDAPTYHSLFTSPSPSSSSSYYYSASADDDEFGYQQKFLKKPANPERTAYGYILKIKKVLDKGMKIAGKDTRAHNQRMLLKINKALKIK